MYELIQQTTKHEDIENIEPAIGQDGTGDGDLYVVILTAIFATHKHVATKCISVVVAITDADMPDATEYSYRVCS